MHRAIAVRGRRRAGLLVALLALIMLIGVPAVAAADSRVDATPSAECAKCDAIHAAARAAVRELRATDDAAADSAVVYGILFWSESCPHCHTVLSESLPPILERYGHQLQIVLANVSQQAPYEVWIAAMEERDIPAEGQVVPMLIIGDHALTGSIQIPEELPGLVDRYLAEGGVALPDDVQAAMATAEAAQTVTPRPPVDSQGSAAAPPIHAVYFYQTGCDVCTRADHELRNLTERYPQVVIERYDVRDSAALNQYLCDRYGVPADKHLTAPALFVGNGYLLDDDIRASTIEALVAPLLETGAPDPSEGFDAARHVAEQSIVERFQSFGLFTVLGAGLLDGINPCAFATMIFLVSYLSVRRRHGRALLATGAAFTLGVFITYLAVGLGLVRFLGSLPFLNTIARWLYVATALLCLALAVGSFLDYRKAREGRLEDMSLKLPARLRGWSRRLIREGVSSQRFVLSAFALGLGVSVIELACTGQVYLPTIVFVLNLPEWRTQASLLLVLYNLMFVLPLVGVFALVYLGTTSQQLIRWMNRHTATVKLGTTALFLLLAGWLVRSAVAL
jgi:cytochrome c biogenesis protein CcdA/thiol-disulfide isomerase/thioredoxin